MSAADRLRVIAARVEELLGVEGAASLRVAVVTVEGHARPELLVELAAALEVSAERALELPGAGDVCAEAARLWREAAAILRGARAWERRAAARVAVPSGDVIAHLLAGLAAESPDGAPRPPLTRAEQLLVELRLYRLALADVERELAAIRDTN